MSCWELAMLEGQGRIRFDRGVVSWLRRGLDDERTILLPVTLDVAIRGGSSQPSLPDPADGIIYATAVEHDAILLSRDARLRDHDPKRVVW